MKVLFIFCLFFVLSKNSTAQQVSLINVNNAKTNVVDSLINKKSTGTVNFAQKTATSSEAIPTPQQQGFSKLETGGKDVYVKTVGDVIISLKPE